MFVYRHIREAVNPRLNLGESLRITQSLAVLRQTQRLPSGWNGAKKRPVSSHRTWLGARVARQRCPILPPGERKLSQLILSPKAVNAPLLFQTLEGTRPRVRSRVWSAISID